MNKPLKICVDARLLDGSPGGVQQVVLGLASGFSRLEGPEEYHFLVYPGLADWILPELKGPCRPLYARPLKVMGLPLARWKSLKAFQPLYRKLEASRLMAWKPVKLPASDGTVEAAGMDVVHFTFQRAFTTALPSLYQPHDLQHLHYPQFFSDFERRRRETLYRGFCAQARLVVLMSRWGQNDLLERYGTAREKTRVIPWASMLQAYPEPTAADLLAFKRAKGLPGKFFYFPAQTFPHKNHLGLLKAMALLRDRKGLRLPVVFSGKQNEFYPVLARAVKEMKLEDQTWFLGYVGNLEIQCLYRLSTALVFPSYFEGWGLPVTEALESGVPVACSDAACLPEQAGDAALYFNPDKPEEIAQAMARLWEDGALRESLAARGRQRAAQFSWEKTALQFRDLYRQMAARTGAVA